MKIRLSEKHFKVRLSVLLTFCFLIFIVWQTIILSSELRVKKSELNKGEGVVLFVRESYDTIHRLTRPPKYEPCIDIILNDNQPFIRFSKDYEKYKAIFKNLNFIDEEISYLYHDRRSSRYKIYNPSELIIGGTKLVDFNEERRNEKMLFPLIVLLDILALGFLMVGIITYFERYLHEDKVMIQNKDFIKLLGRMWSE